MHGSPLSDDSSQHSDPGLLNDCIINGAVNHTKPRQLDNALYSQCVSAMCTLAKYPSPRIAGLGRRVLSIIGIEQVVTKSVKPAAASVRLGESSATASSLAGLARSSSWFDMNGGLEAVHLIRGYVPVVVSIKERTMRGVVSSLFPTLDLNGLGDNGGMLRDQLSDFDQILQQFSYPNTNSFLNHSNVVAGAGANRRNVAATHLAGAHRSAPPVEFGFHG